MAFSNESANNSVGTDDPSQKKPAVAAQTGLPGEPPLRANSDAALRDQGFRAQAIEEIMGDQNKNRKNDAMRRYEVYKDGTIRYVKEQLQKEMSGDVAADMMNRVADISIVKTIVEKRARVYKSTVQRVITDPLSSLDKTKVQGFKEKLMGIFSPKKKPATPPAPPDPTQPAVLANTPEKSEDQKKLDMLEEYLGVDAIMKKANRVTELHHNGMIQLIPHRKDDGTWAIKPMVLHPHQYDVIEDVNNPEEPRAIILSHFVRALPPAISAWTGSRPAVSPNDNEWRSGTNSAQGTIAGPPNDEGAKTKPRFIWWTASNHFVTDDAGAIVDNDPDDPDDGNNPIGILPFIPIHIDQDGAYWAVGGDDLTNMAILINVLLTDLNFTMKYQGAGVFYAFGHGIPKAIQIGPNRAVIWEVQQGDPEPKIGFASAAVNVDHMLNAIDEQLGFLLSSNGLEVQAISGKLAAGRTNSGVQELIQRSEVIEAIEDQQAIYRRVEKHFYKVAAAWVNYLNIKRRGDEHITEIGQMNMAAKLQVKYQAPSVFATELEKVQTLTARKALGIDTTKELIMMDNPDLTDEQINAKLTELQTEKLANKATFSTPTNEAKPGDPSNPQPTPPTNPPQPPAGNPPNGQVPTPPTSESKS